MIVFDCPQRSDEWWELRMGIPTASEADKIITPKKGELSQQCEGLINTLIAERAGLEDPKFNSSYWMDRGSENEDESRVAFQIMTGHEVEPVGFIMNDDRTAGCSPDGLYLERTCGLEMKNPKPSTHVGYLRWGRLPETYVPQINMSMAVSGLQAWTFMSYCAGMPPLIVDVEWNDYTDRVAKALEQFNWKLNAALKHLNMEIAA